MGETEKLLYAIGDYCRVFGISPRRVEIFTYEDKEGQAGFAMPVPAKFYMLAPQPAPPPSPQPGVEEDSAAVRERIACTVDIIDMLRAKRFPLTETRLLFEFSRAGKKWRLGLVVKCLRDMVADGTVENPPEAKPRGYRLPEGSTEEPPEESGE